MLGFRASFAGVVAATMVASLTVAVSPTFAEIVGTTTLMKDPANGIPFASPDQALGAPWVSYTLGFQSTAGELIGAVLMDIKGPLHQRWTDSDQDNVFESTTISSNTTNGDSHATTPCGLFMVGACPQEDNSGIGSPLLDTAQINYGLGTRLFGPSAYQTPTTSADFAYIVIAKGEERNLQIEILVADPQGNIISELGSADFFSVVPEPASVSLLGLTAMLLTAFSRRRVIRV